MLRGTPQSLPNSSFNPLATYLVLFWSHFQSPRAGQTSELVQQEQRQSQAISFSVTTLLHVESAFCRAAQDGGLLAPCPPLCLWASQAILEIYA